MAQTTVELGRLIERTNFELFDFTYTVDDPLFKAELEARILDFFYDYEIGFETPDLFKRKFKARLNRIIPYYNKLYNTTLLSYNPLINSKMTEALDQLATAVTSVDTLTDTTGKNTSNHDSTVTGGNDSNTKNSDYPQQAIGTGDFLNGESNTVANNNSTTDSVTITDVIDKVIGSADSTNTIDTVYTKTIEGLTGTSYQELITKERDIILNIPLMVIEELKPCFILVH